MPTFHIHIHGRVQGVGFRPFVFDTARKHKLTGWAVNSGRGLEIRIKTSNRNAGVFLDEILQNAPIHSLITGHSIREAEDEPFDTFTIRKSKDGRPADVLIPPDTALCASCKKEMDDPDNRRYRYPFTTCLHCGPRYSIIRKLPYDRENTSMSVFGMCRLCEIEYYKAGGNRQHSQTQSCPDCAIPMHFYDKNGTAISGNSEEILDLTQKQLEMGKIVAVKGIGGYLLMCDATNSNAVDTLRARKERSRKPFAVMYPDIEQAALDAKIHPAEEEALLSTEAPVVICLKKNTVESGLCHDRVAPELDSIGILLPYNPLFYLISRRFQKPLIATSANLSGSPIIYRDEDALQHLKILADSILTFDREILIPQDDSVVRFTPNGQRIILRRSRGMAPVYYPSPFARDNPDVFGAGAELKNAFALLEKNRLLVSQYLGNQASYDSQLAFDCVREHLENIYDTKPKVVLADAHPDYFISGMAGQIAKFRFVHIKKIQHHEAHFAAVLAENHLLKSSEPVLGVVWDGTGYGSDSQIWGGEFFTRKNGKFTRICHLDYFPVLSGGKMSLQPRLSALSLLKDFPESRDVLRKHFNQQEWDYYQKRLTQPPEISTSSMGRLFDGVAALLGLCQINTYEGEAGGVLEACARAGTGNHEYPIEPEGTAINWRPLITAVLNDISSGLPVEEIARAFIRSLCTLIYHIAKSTGIHTIALSGGVFQNALLTELLLEEKPKNIQLVFHQQLSPNDECIGFGQVAHYLHGKK